MKQSGEALNDALKGSSKILDKIILKTFCYHIAERPGVCRTPNEMKPGSLEGGSTCTQHNAENLKVRACSCEVSNRKPLCKAGTPMGCTASGRVSKKHTLLPRKKQQGNLAMLLGGRK